MTTLPIDEVVDLDAHPIHDDAFRDECRAFLDRDGALVLEGFVRPEVVEDLVAEAESLQATPAAGRS